MVRTLFKNQHPGLGMGQRFTRCGLSSSGQQRGARAVNQQRPQVGIAPSADFSKTSVLSRTRFFRGDTEPGGKTACAGKAANVLDACGECGGIENTDARCAHQLLADRVCLGDVQQLRVNGLDALMRRSDVIGHSVQSRLKNDRNLIDTVAQPAVELLCAGGKRDSEFKKECAGLIDTGGSSPNPLGANAVQCL